MAFIGNLLSGSKGAGYNASSAAQLNPTTVGQANTAYDQTQQGIQQQQAFLQALQGQNGIQNQSSVFNQMQGVANGTGPNPAQAMLNQATGQNSANQAALMAGQRGASSNAGLIARQAGMQGAANQQNAAGQAATMQANQSLGALNQMGQMAGQQVGQQQGAISGLNQASQGQQQNILGGIANQNANATAMMSNMNSANSGVAQQNAKTQGGILSNLAGGIGTVLGLAQGGQVPPSGPISKIGQHLRTPFARGGAVPAMVSPGEKYLTPDEADAVKRGANPTSMGEIIPGKAKVKGDSLKNDIVPKTLQEGGCMIPREVMLSKNPMAETIKFVHAHMRKSKGKK